MEDPQVTMSCNTKICSKTWMILDGLGYHCHYFRKPPDNIQMLLGVNHDYTNLQISVCIYMTIPYWDVRVHHPWPMLLSELPEAVVSCA
jgi:hypothetical protein